MTPTPSAASSESQAWSAPDGTGELPALTVAARSGKPPLSITDFLTDGSLAGMCDELTRLTGVPVVLRDPMGRRVVPAQGPSHWTYAGVEPDPPAPGETVVPLRVGGHVIGSLVLGPGEPHLPAAGARTLLHESLAFLATTAAEFCRQELDLRHRVKEVQALYRLSGLLARATRLDAVLDIALESALDVLELDAGSIVLFEDEEGVSSENEEDLVLKTSRNLSREWLECPLPLSKGRCFDRMALKGEIVVSHDLLGDERVLIADRVAREGLRSAMHAGMVFQDKALGVIRLYSRSPRDFTDAEMRLLRGIAHQAAVAVEQARLLKLQERDARVQRQVQLAADVQRRMLPRKVPQIPPLDVAARYVPSFELGGDFYDFFELPGGNLGIAVGDVVGKGLAAALLMSAVRASLRAHVQDIYHIGDVISRVNVALSRDTLDNEFATFWYGVVDAGRLRLTYCSAGHEPPFVVRQGAAGRTILELTAGGMAVGIDPGQRYASATFDLHPGDVLVAYTDGVTDTLDFGGKRFGKARLRQAVLAALAEDAAAPAAKVVERVYWELRQFAGLLERPDDQTAVVMRVGER
jgi:sigma-B regulation protein RsbU (phosphoserine phosphatase)